MVLSSRRTEPSVAALVSIVIPVRNRERLIDGAVQSALAQTYPNVQVVVADDGSTDGTLQVVEELARHEPRLVVVSHAASRGAQAARNTGIHASSGAWVTFLDSDDRYLPESVSLRIREAERAGVGVVHSEARRVSSTGIDPTFGVPALEGPVYRDLLRQPAVLFPSLLVRRDLLEAIGFLDESIVAWQEWETAIRLGRIATFGFVPAATFDYDVRTVGAISRDGRRAVMGYGQIVAKHRWAILRRCGPRALSDHYRTLARLSGAAADRRRELWYRVLTGIWWPPRVVRAVLAAGRRIRPRRARSESRR